MDARGKMNFEFFFCCNSEHNSHSWLGSISYRCLRTEYTLFVREFSLILEGDINMDAGGKMSYEIIFGILFQKLS